MIQPLKQYLQANKRIVENFSYLSLAQLFNMLFPIITFPYLVSVLGAELYGEIVYAQVIATYFSIVVSYGFNVSGAKEVAIHREAHSKLSEIVSVIMGIKVIFFLLSFFLFATVLLLLGLDKQNFLLYFFSFFVCFNELLFPQWFFQGIEKIKYTTLINLLIKSVFLIFIFLFVRDNTDYLLVPILNAMGAIIGGVASLYVLFFRENITLVCPKRSMLIYYLKNNFPLFLSDIIISVKDRFNVIFIGYFLGMNEVAVYDLGIKLVGLFMAFINVINNAVFPKMSIEKNKNLLKKVMKFSFLFCFISVVMIEPLIPFIVKIVSADLEGAALPIQILLISPVLFALSLPLARNGLIVFGKYQLMLWGMLFTTLFYLLCIFLGYSWNILGGVSVFATITVLTYGFELCYRLMICRKLSII